MQVDIIDERAQLNRAKNKIIYYEDELNKLKNKLDQSFEYNQKYSYEAEIYFNPMAYHHRILADIFCETSEAIESILKYNE